MCQSLLDIVAGLLALGSGSITTQPQAKDNPNSSTDHLPDDGLTRGSTVIACLPRFPSRLSPLHPDPRRRYQGVLSELDTLQNPIALEPSSMHVKRNPTENPGCMSNEIELGQTFNKPHEPQKLRKQAGITIHVAEIFDRHEYLERLCRALMTYGAPTHRLEEYMIMSARVLEIEAQFLYIPSSMIVSFDDSTAHITKVKIIRVRQGIDLGRLRDVHNIYKQVVHDELSVEEGTRELEAVMTKDPYYSTWFRVFLYGVASACVAPFAFQGRFVDLGPAFLLGALLGTLQLVLAPSNELYAHIFEVSAAVITSFLARAMGSVNGGDTFCFSALAQSSIVLILPGYMVLCSSLELQSCNIVAGSVRMVHAMIYALFLGYGITLGASLYGLIDKNATSATTCQSPLSRDWHALFVIGFTLCLCLINHAKWKQTPVMISISITGFVVNSYCSQFFRNNTPMPNMLGALTVGILANIYSRIGRHIKNTLLDIGDFWRDAIRPRLRSPRHRKRLANEGSDAWSPPSVSDPESCSGSLDLPPQSHQRRRVGYSLAAAAMLPAIFVQVPSGLAAGGGLVSGVTSADRITSSNASGGSIDNFDGTAFNVLCMVVQVAIGMSVGLFMSALIVYPLGKRRSGLLSF